MATTEITNCEFNGVVFDGEAMEAITNITEALLNLTKLFVTQNIVIDSLLKIDSTENKTNTAQ